MTLCTLRRRRATRGIGHLNAAMQPSPCRTRMPCSDSSRARSAPDRKRENNSNRSSNGKIKSNSESNIMSMSKIKGKIKSKSRSRVRAKARATSTTSTATLTATATILAILAQVNLIRAGRQRRPLGPGSPPEVVLTTRVLHRLWALHGPPPWSGCFTDAHDIIRAIRRLGFGIHGP